MRINSFMYFYHDDFKVFYQLFSEVENLVRISLTFLHV